MTGLHLACERDNVESVKLILDFAKYFARENNGIDLNARDEDGKTAFWRACYSGKIRIIKLLIDNWKELDIDIKSKNNEGQTALDVLTINGNEGFKEVKTMLEKEYSKIDAFEPPSKVPKMSDDEVAKPALGPEMISDILQKTEELKNMIALYDNDPIRKNEAKASLDKVNAIYQDLLKEKRKK